MGQISRTALGISLIIGSVLWALFWGFIALLGDSFGSDVRGWVIVSVALSVGVLGVVLGINVARRRIRVGLAGLRGVS